MAAKEKIKEEKYTLKITETELKNKQLLNGLLEVIKLRLRMQKTKPYYTISSVEYRILRRHYSWVDVSSYKPIEEDRLKKEVGKYLGKRCCLRGAK